MFLLVTFDVEMIKTTKISCLSMLNNHKCRFRKYIKETQYIIKSKPLVWCKLNNAFLNEYFLKVILIPTGYM